MSDDEEGIKECLSESGMILVWQKDGDVGRHRNIAGLVGNGGGIIKYDKEVGRGIAILDDVVWLYW